MRFSSWAGAISAYYPPSSLDPAVSDWVSRVNAAGGSVSAPQADAVNAFVAGLKTDGLWTKIRRLNPFVGEQLAACLIPLINTLGNAADTNNNFVSGDFSQTLGLLTDGATKYLATGAAPASVIGGISVYLHGTPPTDLGVQTSYIGCRDGTLVRTFQLNSTTTPGYQGNFGAAQTAQVSSALPGGLLQVERRSTSDMELYQAGASVATNTNVIATGGVSYGMFVGARNNDGSPQLYTVANTRIGGYSLTDGTMTDTDAANYATRWNTLRSSL